MAANKELGFPPYEGLPGSVRPPTIDGFVEPEPGITPPDLEPGYVNGGRFVYGGDGGIPLAVVTCVRDQNNDLIHLGIQTRNNIAFESSDFVMVVIRPGGPSAADTNDLYIHIRPVDTNTNGAKPATTMPPQPGDSTAPGPDVRGNRAPAFATRFLERAPTTPTPPRKWRDRAMPTGAEVKVRSTFTGSARGWSVELKLPTNAANWVPLSSPFGLYIDVGRKFTVANQNYVNQTSWPFDPAHPERNVVINDPNFVAEFIDNWDIPATTVQPNSPAGIGSGLIVTSQTSNPAKGVKFKAGADSIGVLSGGVISNVLDTTVGHMNRLVAELLDTDVDAPGVTAEFRVANFGVLGPTNSNLYGASWELASAMPNPTAGQTIFGAPSGAQQITLDWTIDQAAHDKLRKWDHTCMLVRLGSNAPPPAAVNFVQESVRTNLFYTGMSEVELGATIDGPSHGTSMSNDGKHHVILHVVKIPIPRVKGDLTHGGDAVQRYYAELFGPLLAAFVTEFGDRETLGWISIVNSYFITDKVLTMDGSPHKVVVPGGSYGVISEHVLERGETHDNVDLDHTLEGGGLNGRGDGIYTLTMGEGDRVQIFNQLETVRTDQLGGPWWQRLLRWLLKLLRRLLRALRRLLRRWFG